MTASDAAMPWKMRRKLILPVQPSPDILAAVAGVLEFRPDSGPCWQVIYDVRKVQFATIAAALIDVCPSGLFWRLQVRWRQFQDVNVRDNLLAQEAACCNRPPSRR